MKQFVLPAEPDTDSDTMVLRGKGYHYLIHVRRCSAGDRITALSPGGRRFVMEIVSLLKDHCLVRLEQIETLRDNDTGVQITLMPGLTRGGRMDLTVRQAVETGVCSVWPVITEYCQVKSGGGAEASNRMGRWKRIAVEALQQCGGVQPTVLEPPRTLDEVIDLWGARGPLIFLHEKPPEKDIRSSLHRHLAEPLRELAIMIGPEGGFSPSETRRMRELGALPVYLGGRVLRAETAAVFAIAAAATIIRERSEWQPA